VAKIKGSTDSENRMPHVGVQSPVKALISCRS